MKRAVSPAQKKDNATIDQFGGCIRVSRLAWDFEREDRYRAAGEIAVLLSGCGVLWPLGDKDKAFEYLEKGSQKRGWMKMFPRVDPRFDPLHDDARFNTFVRRVEGK